MSEQRKIVEDAPEMRSVAMHSVTPMPMMARSSLERLKAAPSIPSAFASPRANTKQKTKENVWSVDSLPSMPLMYFLERTHVYVSNASPKEVARRVADCLRRESIAANYNEVSYWILQTEQSRFKGRATKLTYLC
jgi:hypothetical protein